MFEKFSIFAALENSIFGACKKFSIFYGCEALLHKHRKSSITDVSQLNVDDLTERLSNKELCFEDNCYFELDINYDKESEVMLRVIVFYPLQNGQTTSGIKKKL